MHTFRSRAPGKCAVVVWAMGVGFFVWQAGAAWGQLQIQTFALGGNGDPIPAVVAVGDAGELAYSVNNVIYAGPWGSGTILGGNGSLTVGGAPISSFSLQAYRSPTNFAVFYFSTPVGSQFGSIFDSHQPVAGLPGYVYGSSSGSLQLNQSGQLLWSNEVLDGSMAPSYALIGGAPSSVQGIARRGDQAVGFPAGVIYSTTSDDFAARINDAGHVVFAIGLSGSISGSALYSGPINGINRIVASSDSVVSLGGDATFTSMSVPAINDHGHLVFRANVAGSGITTSNNSLIVVRQGASESVVLREGDSVAGGPTGMVYVDPAANSMMFSNNGRFFSRGSVRIGAGVTRAALISGETTDPGVIAYVGEQAPDLPAGVLFDEFSHLAFNDLGQAAYMARLQGAGVTAFNRFALYLFDPAFGNLLVARDGDLFDVGGGDMRTIEGIGFRSLLPFQSLSDLGDSGVLAFNLGFTDFTGGIFTATVPEPASIAGVGGLIAALAPRRRK